MDADPDEYNMEEVRLENKIYHHWRMVFEKKNRGVYDDKTILHAKMWGVYTR